MLTNRGDYGMRHPVHDGMMHPMVDELNTNWNLKVAERRKEMMVEEKKTKNTLPRWLYHTRLTTGTGLKKEQKAAMLAMLKAERENRFGKPTETSDAQDPAVLGNEG